MVIRCLKNAPLAAVALAFLSCNAPAPLDDEAVYMERYERAENAVAGQTLSHTYDTLAPVIGADAPTPLPAAQTQRINETALDEAFAYAAGRNTSAMAVLQGGAVVRAQYFQGTNSQTPIVGKSLAKPLAVLAVGAAIKQGHIDGLDQPASDFITEWKGTPKEGILIRHLLQMRSGLKRQSAYSGPEDVMRRAYLHPRHDEIIINDYPLTDAPGTRYDYSNANGELIAPLITRATGARYETWIGEQILQPLGAPGGEVWVNRPGGMAHSGCCIMLPAQSWIKLALLIMNDGVWDGARILPAGFAQDMAQPTPQNPYAGMGIYNGRPFTPYRGAQNPDQKKWETFHSAPYLAQDLLLFDGNDNQVIYMVPSQDLVIARFGNRPPKELAWDNAFLPNVILSGLKQPEALSED